ncbi:THAP domain-containing protein 2-like [Vanessa atalanta]|uniref:THAP domain-containing protein 2-like n=1 Tax=Vanessa atalanta TaxID=42275 RepID=UPI001FCD72A2|nr:THAP domain-containing protein 2-like [Vanessa atalanta]
MPSCVFRKCTNYDTKVNKTQGISYHMFPTSEIQLQEWIAIVRKQRSECSWTPSKSSRICSNHFKATDKYSSNKGRTLLKKNAVPVIEENININIKNSPTSLDNVSVQDMEDIFETPRKAALKKRVRELTCKTKLLQKKNKVLVQQNKRLKKRVTNIALILKDLKKKDYIPKEQLTQLLNYLLLKCSLRDKK